MIKDCKNCKNGSDGVFDCVIDAVCPDEVKEAKKG